VVTTHWSSYGIFFMQTMARLSAENMLQHSLQSYSQRLHIPPMGLQVRRMYLLVRKDLMPAGGATTKSATLAGHLRAH